MLEDLKANPNIPSTLWDPFLDQGIIKIDSSLKHKQETRERFRKKTPLLNNYKENELCYKEDYKNTESSVRLKEELDVEMQMRENELLQKFVDEKEKIRLLDDRERQEHEEKFREKLRE